MDGQYQLLQKKQELEQLIQTKRDNFGISMSETTNELSSYDQHPADLASDLYEREKDAGLLELLELELEKVDDALVRCQQGKYGICEKCGQPIEEQRLQRLSNTTVCASCAGNMEKQSVEYRGGSISASTMGDMGEAFQVAGYEMYEE